MDKVFFFSLTFIGMGSTYLLGRSDKLKAIMKSYQNKPKSTHEFLMGETEEMPRL